MSVRFVTNSRVHFGTSKSSEIKHTKDLLILKYYITSTNTLNKISVYVFGGISVKILPIKSVCNGYSENTL